MTAACATKFKGPLVALDYLWWGVSIGGRHYTANIRVDGKSIEMVRKLGRKEGKLYAQEMGITWGSWPTETNKFETMAQLFRFATKWCENNMESDWLLLEHETDNPQLPIAAAGRFAPRLKYLRKLAKFWDKVPNCQRTEEAFDIMFKAWRPLVA